MFLLLFWDPQNFQDGVNEAPPGDILDCRTDRAGPVEGLQQSNEARHVERRRRHSVRGRPGCGIRGSKVKMRQKEIDEDLQMGEVEIQKCLASDLFGPNHLALLHLAPIEVTAIDQ